MHATVGIENSVCDSDYHCKPEECQLTKARVLRQNITFLLLPCLSCLSQIQVQLSGSTFIKTYVDEDSGVNDRVHCFHGTPMIPGSTPTIPL